MTLVRCQVSESAALSPQGQTSGALRDNAVTTTAVSFDVTAWQGRMITISVTGGADYRFAETTGATLDVSTEHAVASTAGTTGAALADMLPSAGRWSLVVPRSEVNGAGTTGKVWLRIASFTGTINVSIVPG